MKRVDETKRTDTPGATAPAPTKHRTADAVSLALAPLAVMAMAAVLALLAITAAGCGGGRGTEAEPAPAPTVRAELGTAERVTVPRRIEVIGAVEAERTAAVSSRVMATVTAVHAQAGDRVVRGALLVEIDPATAAGQLAQARGGLGQARAALALAERNLERYRALAATDAASELELDLARSQFEAARGAVEGAEGAVAAASSLAGDARVTAPFAGKVVRRMVEVGDLTVPGRPLFEIESEGARRLALSVAESAVAAGGVALGGVLPLTIDARPDLGELAGRVVEMTPGADPASHAYTVKVALPGDAGSAVPSGVAGRAAIELPGEGRPAVTVPAAAVLPRGGLLLVVVRDADGRAASRAVTVGERLDGGRIEVLSGLAGGETVLVGLAAPPPSGTMVEPAGGPASGGGQS